MAVPIKSVQPHSPAALAGVCGGMQLLSIDGNPIDDGLDYEFYSVGANPVLEVLDNGHSRTIAVVKEEYQPLGCVFESYLIDKHRHCKNKCVFCFIDQLPKGMRPSLYFKDDDERLSFLFGNYITLTNLSPKEVDRIIEMRFSPVNISVHTANPALRVKMMGNPGAGKALEIIPRLAAAGISLNFQLVLLPGWNDGEELRRSLDWLCGFYPATQSIAAVPVGLTRHRQGLAPLRPYDSQTAARQLDILLRAGDEMLKKHDLRVIYPSDEWFLLAGRPIPPEEFYDGYPQLENGVGMWRMMAEEFTAALDEQDAAPAMQADIAVGVLAAPLLQTLSRQLTEKFPGVRLHVHPVQNDFFGHGVTVTGLLTGQDLIAQLQGRLKSNLLLLPADLLRAEGDVTLDDKTPDEIARALGVRVEVLPTGGAQLAARMLQG